jgi:hypothetical protein
MIFTAEPWYNEPGRELLSQKAASESYNINIQYATVQHAMLQWLDERLASEGLPQDQIDGPTDSRLIEWTKYPTMDPNSHAAIDLTSNQTSGQTSAQANGQSSGSASSNQWSKLTKQVSDTSVASAHSGLSASSTKAVKNGGFAYTPSNPTWLDAVGLPTEAQAKNWQTKPGYAPTAEGLLSSGAFAFHKTPKPYASPGTAMPKPILKKPVGVASPKPNLEPWKQHGMTAGQWELVRESGLAYRNPNWTPGGPPGIEQEWLVAPNALELIPPTQGSSTSAESKPAKATDPDAMEVEQELPASATHGETEKQLNKWTSFSATSIKAIQDSIKSTMESEKQMMNTLNQFDTGSDKLAHHASADLWLNVGEDQSDGPFANQMAMINNVSGWARMGHAGYQGLQGPRPDDAVWGDVVRKYFEAQAEAILATARRWDARFPKHGFSLRSRRAAAAAPAKASAEKKLVEKLEASLKRERFL